MSAPKPVYVMLGRHGDLLNIFPILLEQNNAGLRPTIVTTKGFAHTVEGISYADRLIFHGDIGDIRTAAEKARKRFPQAKVLQLWGNDWRAPRKTENFLREHYFRAGSDSRFEQASLIIDRRDQGREDALVAETLKENTVGKPVLLLNLSGVSYPFAAGGKLFAKLTAELQDEFFIVDLTKPNIARIYDLLGLMDVASCLVTVDTAPLHLSNASAIPVCALVADDAWIGTLRRPNHIYRARYSEVYVEELVEAIRKTAVRKTNQKIVHVYSRYAMGPMDFDRHTKARESWLRTYSDFPGWRELPVENTGRTSKSELGDTRSMPYIKDLIDAGMAETTSDFDVVVLTNSDVGFSPGVTERLRRLMAVRGACFAYRFDFAKVHDSRMTNIQTVSGGWCGGIDLVAFTRKFWREHRDRFPDSLLGCANWDTHYRDLIKYFRGGELYGSHWHEAHPPLWMKLGRNRNVGNLHNSKLFNAFKHSMDTTRPYSL